MRAPSPGRPATSQPCCRASPPRPGVERVRLPGEAALARRRQALAEGVALYPGIMEGLAARAQRIGVPVPELRTP